MVLPDHRIRTFRALHPDSAVPVAAFGAASASAAKPAAGLALAARAAATDWLLYRQRSGLSGRGRYDCIGRHVSEMEQPEPAHPRPL
eukprot:scaffold30280_cov57-Phaeocystis_antarctica.AAC.2